MEGLTSTEGSPKLKGENDFDAIYKEFIAEAPYISCLENELVPVTEVTWVKPELLKDGREFFWKNTAAVYLANAVALLGGFLVPPLASVFARGGGFFGETFFARGVGTLERLTHLYEGDLLSEDSPAFQNIKFSRKIHAVVRKSRKELPFNNEIQYPEFSILCEAIRKDLEFLNCSQAPLHLFTWTPDVQFSQFDLAMAIVGEVAPFYLAPEFVCCKFDQKGADGYSHIWALIGRLIGLEDRFNFAINPNPTFFCFLRDNIVLASLKHTDVTMMHMPNNFLEVIKQRVYLITLKSFMCFALKGFAPESKLQNVWSLMNWYDKLCYALINLAIKALYHLDFIKPFLNWFTYRYINTQTRKLFPGTPEQRMEQELSRVK